MAKNSKKKGNDYYLEPKSDRQIFYIFCAMMRMRNQKYFDWWTVINSAAYQGKAMTNITSFFGITMRPWSMIRKLEKHIDSSMVMERGRKELLKSGSFGVSAIDNTQIITPKKYQRGGQSSKMNMYTTRLFFRATNPPELNRYNWRKTVVEITYLRQAIPPPNGMPLYHMSGNIITTSNFEPPAFPKYVSVHDEPGSCVEAYVRRFQISQVVHSFRKYIPHHSREDSPKGFEYQYEDATAKMFQSGIPKLLDPNRMPCGDESMSFYKYMHEFPRRATTRWRGETEKVAILVQPLSKMDETTNKGAAIVVISQLIMFGILKPTNNDGTQGDPNHLELNDGWEKRQVMFVGDGLTMARVKSFEDHINNTCIGFAKRHEKAIMLRKAMSRVIIVTGDLHGCFHCLMSVYSIFYGCLIQPIQTILKWKRIQGSDITKCYQQAAGLAIMISDEIERHLLSQCISELNDDDEALLKISLIMSNRKEVAIFIAKYYIDWLESKRVSTTDEVFRMCINFTTIMHTFKNMVMAVRSGDSIMIESIYIQMLPVFQAVGKKNYVEIVCSMVENLYGPTLDAKGLQLVRMNRTFPLYTGRNSRGELMAHKAIDDHVEGQQPGYATLGTNPEDKEAFSEASIHVTMFKKASQFAKIQYYRNETNARRKDRKNNEYTKNKDGSVKPKREIEHHAIAEFLKAIEATKECPGRVYSRTAVWESMADLTVVIKNRKEKERRKFFSQRGDFNVDGFAEDMYDNVFGEDGGEDGESSNQNEDGGEVNVELPGQFYGESNGLEEEDVDDMEVEVSNNSNNRADAEEVEVITANRVKIRVRRAAVNSLAFKDIISKGMNDLESKNLPQHRFRRLLRERRKRKMDDHVYKQSSAFGDESEENENNIYEMAKLKRMKYSIT